MTPLKTDHLTNPGYYYGTHFNRSALFFATELFIVHLTS